MSVRSPYLVRAPRPGPDLLLATALGLLFFLVSTGFAVAQHLTFHTRARDMGIWTQAFWSAAQGRPLETTLLERDTNLLAEHVELPFLALAPLAGLAPDPVPLLVLQQLALAACGLPLYLVARARLQPALALALLLCFYLMPALSRVSLSEYHSVVVAALPVAAGLACALLGRPRSAVLLLLLAILVEEEASPTAAGVGAMLALYAVLHRWQPKALSSWAMTGCRPSLPLSFSLMAVGVLWALLVVLMLLPSFRLRLPASAGETPNRAASHYQLVQQNPGIVSTWLTADRGPDALAWLLLPSGGLALVAPEVLAVGLPSFLVLFLQDRPGSYAGHWSGPLLPLVWLATAVALGRLARRRQLLWAGLALMLGGTAVAYRLDSYFPGGRQFQADHYEATELEADLRRAVDQVTPGASLVASRRVIPHLITRRELYQLPQAFYAAPLRPDLRRQDFLILDLTDSPTRQAVAPSEADSVLERRPRYHVQRFGPSVLLLSRARPRPSETRDETFAGTVRLLGLDGPVTERHSPTLPLFPSSSLPGSLTVTLYWEALRRPETEPIRVLRLLGPSGESFAEVAGLPLDEFLPPRDWDRGQVVAERITLPPVEPLGSATYRLAVAWRSPDGRPLVVDRDGSPELELTTLDVRTAER